VIDRFKGADAHVAHKSDFERSFLGHHLGQATWICTCKVRASRLDRGRFSGAANYPY
jgi:hypothetical protein